MFRALLLVSLVVGQILCCLREPQLDLQLHRRSPGDNGYRISLTSSRSFIEPETYTPGKAYTITLSGERTFDNLQQFTHFMIGVEPQNKKFATPEELSPQRLGQFMLFPDNIAQYNQECVNTVKEANTLQKTEAKVMWLAPRAGTGCVVFRAMVMEADSQWWSEDGTLSKTICEQEFTEQETSKNGECCACDDAKYRMVFEGLWSSETHPKDYPISSKFTHFSDVIGASHDPTFSFWGEKQIATDGFRTLAEWGSGGLLLQELRSNGNRLRSIVKAAGLWYPRVNANTTATFKVDRKHPKVSLASMFGPSPDWVVGVNGLDLCLSDCTWRERVEVDLLPYDAGTDSGVTYLSPNAETNPKERMYRITTMYPEDPRAPFYDPSKREITPLAKLYLVRESLTPRSCDNVAVQAVEETENTETTIRPECETTPWSEWSSCSSTCGKGLRMRTREYLMPMKAQMFQCDRQIVSKEMCVANIEECGPGGLPAAVSEEDGSFEDLSGLCDTTEWSSWSSWSATCGEGIRRRQRKFIKSGVNKKCYHIKRVERETTNLTPCEEEEITVPGCPTTGWSDWSPCSASCGRGVTIKTRLLLLDPRRAQQCRNRVELEQRKECRTECTVTREVCHEPAESGPCRSNIRRFYYNTYSGRCQVFTYGGCKGNGNNFATLAACQQTCIA